MVISGGSTFPIPPPLRFRAVSIETFAERRPDWGHALEVRDGLAADPPRPGWPEDFRVPLGEFINGGCG